MTYVMRKPICLEVSAFRQVQLCGERKNLERTHQQLIKQESGRKPPFPPPPHGDGRQRQGPRSPGTALTLTLGLTIVTEIILSDFLGIFMPFSSFRPNRPRSHKTTFSKNITNCLISSSGFQNGVTYRVFEEKIFHFLYPSPFGRHLENFQPTPNFEGFQLENERRQRIFSNGN